MSNGAKIANAVAAGTRGRHRAFDAWVLLILVMAWSAAPGAVAADTLVLQGGESIDGSIVDATRNTVVIRRAVGGMRQMGIRDIEQVRIDLAEGRSISGRMLSWVDGVYRIRVGDEVVSVRAGRILGRAPYADADGQSPRSLPPRRQQSRTVETQAAPAAFAPEVPAGNSVAGNTPAESTPAKSAPAESTPAESAPAKSTAAKSAPAKSTPAESTAADSAAAESTPAKSIPAKSLAARSSAGERTVAKSPAGASTTPESTAPKGTAPAQSTAAIGSAAKSTAGRKADGDNEAVAVKASVDPVEAGASDLVFRIELSRPAEQTVVLIYGTVDGTAKAGTDYEPRQGIVTLAPGAKSADVHVPLIEQQPRRGDTRFELFLAADPKVAKILEQRVIATIPGDD